MPQVFGVGTEVLLPASAEGAPSAGDKRVHSHPFADEIGIVLIMDLIDYAHELMPENDVRRIWDFLPQCLLRPWILPEKVPNITAADSALAHADEDLSRTGPHLRDVYHRKGPWGL